MYGNKPARLSVRLIKQVCASDEGIVVEMNVNFFEWLRDGVRQSVLLGVSDAIEQIGTPADSDQLHPNVAALLQGEGSKRKTTKSGGRKKVGKNR